MTAAAPPEGTKAWWRARQRAAQSPIPDDINGAIVAGLARWLEGENGLVLFYRSMPHEVRLEPLADRLGWQRFVTTRTPDEGPLTLHPAVGASEQHRYGFAQPIEGAMELPPHHVSVALVPGLAFDRHGNRLGHGAGYYDELLARLPADRPRVGVACERDVVEELPVDSHDVPMTHLATEAGVRELESATPVLRRRRAR